MEKLILTLETPSGQNAEEWHASLKEKLLPELAGFCPYELRLLIPDNDIKPAAGLRQENIPPLPAALLTFWLDSHLHWDSVEEVVKRYAEPASLMLVLESVPLDAEQSPAASGQLQRLPGFTQVAFLERPEHLAEEDWLAIWLQSHTEVAIDIQSNYRYVQNAVQRLLQGVAPWHAIVTESFPAAAMDDMTVFYECPGDEALMQQRVGEMIDSCARFIDFTRLNVLPCSEFVLKGRFG